MTKDFPSLDILKAGDTTAWNEAFCHLWPMALRAAQHPEAGLVPWEADDVASEAIHELISQIEKITSVDEAKAIVITIAFRRAISLARRKSALKRTLPRDDDFGPSPEISAEFVSDLTEHEQREMTMLLEQALDVLDPETKLVLKEKVEKNLTYHEISLRHSIPLGTVCTKVARGLKKLRLELQKSPLLLKELKEYLR